MNQSKSLIVTAQSTLRPKFSELPSVGASGWFGLYAGYDADVKLVGLNKASLQITSNNKKMRYNLQRILRRESGAYTVVEGSGDLEPLVGGRKGATASWTWGPNKLAGLPVTTIKPSEENDEKRAVMLAQIQLEQTSVSSQSTTHATANTEAMEFNLRMESLLTGEVNRSEDQGKLYIVAIPPPTEDDGLSGDYVNTVDIGIVFSTGAIEFPNDHKMIGKKNTYFAYTTMDDSVQPAENKHLCIEELNKAGLWGEFFKLPFPILMPLASEEDGHDIPALQTCNYGRIGRLTVGDGQCPAGAYVLTPQILNVMDPERVFSVQADSDTNMEYNYLADAILYPANSAFAYEGVNPGTSSTDMVVDGISVTEKKGKGVGYKIHKNLDRQLKSSKSSLIPMPPPDAASFKGGMPLELCTPRGISYLTLIRNSRELKGFWSDLCEAVVKVAKVIVDIANAVSRDPGMKKHGAYYKQYEECMQLAGRMSVNPSSALPDLCHA